jgi:hypothetical protein
VKKYILLLLLVFVFFKLKADTELLIKDPLDYLHYRINLNSKEFLREQKNGVWVNQGKLTFSNIELRDFKILTNQTFDLNGKILISIEGTGQLFELDIKNQTFSSLISTYFRGHNFSSIKFIRKDTLYSLGGSGFWHINNIETFFLYKQQEWELLHRPAEVAPQQILKQFGGYDKKRDVVSVIESPPFYHKSPIKDFHYRYFEKNIKANEWKLLGEVNSELLFKLGVKSLNSIYLNGVYLFMESDLIILGDPIKNKIFIVEKSLPFYSNLYEISENRGYLFSYVFQKYYHNSRINVDSISIEKLKSMGIPKGDFYLKENNEFLPYLILGLLITCILSIYFFNKGKSKRVNFQSIEQSESNLLDALPQGSFEFLKEFLSYPKGHEISSDAITELMGFSSYAYETQRQVRSKLINSINSYFKVHYKMYPIIIRKNSKDDKRFVIYNISEEYFEDLKELLIKSE